LGIRYLLSISNLSGRSGRCLNSWQIPSYLDISRYARASRSRETPIPLELIDSWRLFDTILLTRFEDTQGLQRIKEGHYALQDATSKQDIGRVQELKACFQPGIRIVMSAMFTDEWVDDQCCPSCRTSHPSASDEEICCSRCGMRFQRVSNPDERGQPQRETLRV
jgi:hypothetical protein